MTRRDRTPSNDSFVLHVVPANGGGVDRYVRDICSRRTNDWILHVSEHQVVLEHPHDSVFLPVDVGCEAGGGAASLEAVAKLVGRPSLVHAHSTVLVVRAVVKAICAHANAEYVVTLHDIEFAHPMVPVQPGEVAARTDFAKGAEARIVPSKFIADLAEGIFEQFGTCIVIPNGVEHWQEPTMSREASAPQAAQSAIPKCRVAVIGALGPHKGLQFLRDVTNVRPADKPIVVIGYVDGQLSRGWLSPNSLWVHGAFEPSELREVLNVYEVELVLFPNRQPESYSYALSDVWRAGRPVLVPDTGALGERVRTCGAGWVYSVDATPADVAKLLDIYVEQTSQIAERVLAASAAIQGVDDMVSNLNAIYGRARRDDASGPELSELSAIAAKHLDSAFFRAELRRLVGDLTFVERQRDESDASVVKLSHETRAQSTQLAQREADITLLRSECQRLERQLSAEHNAHVAYAKKLQTDICTTLAIAHRYERALAYIPGPLRRMLLKRADQGTATKESRD